MFVIFEDPQRILQSQFSFVPEYNQLFLGLELVVVYFDIGSP
jgi:hypothetical protein